MSAKDAVKNEATTPEELSFDYDGERYVYTAAVVRDLEVLEAFEDDKVIKAVRLILGPVQWGKFKLKKRTDEDFQGICEAMFDAKGVKPGESSG